MASAIPAGSGLRRSRPFRKCGWVIGIGVGRPGSAFSGATIFILSVANRLNMRGLLC